MPFPTIQKPAPQRAAAAVFGAVTGLILGGQDDAAHYVVDQLDEELLRGLHGLVDDRTDSTLAAWLHERLDTSEAVTRTVAPGPAPVVDPDADAPATLEEKVKRALRVLLPSAVVKDVTSSDAFGALVFRVGQAMEQNDVIPIEVFKKLGESKLALVGSMTDPAAYLTKHVRDDWGLGG